MYIGRISRLLLHLAPFGASVVCVAWLLTQSPFAAPMVDRSLAQIETRLNAAMARQVDLAWLLPRVQIAILEQDLMQLDLLLGLANDHAVVLPAPMIQDIAALDAAASGTIARSTACGACMIDITACETLTQIGACALPFEMTPAGDVNALRRNALLYIEGETIDRLEVGLAIVGLGATGAVLATGGSSYTIKAGTSLLRMARRLGTLSAPLAAHVSGLIGNAVRWDRMGDLAAFRIAPAQMIDSTKLAGLTDLGTSLGRVAGNTSVAEAVSLLRHVDSPQDAARLARITDAIGPKTRAAFEVLGKTRVMRAVVRLSDLAVGAALALYALALQILIFTGQQCGNACLRALRTAGGRRRSRLLR